MMFNDSQFGNLFSFFHQPMKKIFMNDINEMENMKIVCIKHCFFVY